MCSCRTETCSFSESRIYPGHGSRLIRRDGSIHTFVSSKSKSLFLQRKKATKILWTLGWRRMNKKIKVQMRLIQLPKRDRVANANRFIIGGGSVASSRSQDHQDPACHCRCLG